jgi:hypothetical protein
MKRTVVYRSYGHPMGTEGLETWWKAPPDGLTNHRALGTAPTGRARLRGHTEQVSAAAEQLGTETARSGLCNAGLLGVDTA